MIFRGVFNLDRHGRARKHSIGFACNDESQRYSQTAKGEEGGGQIKIARILSHVLPKFPTDVHREGVETREPGGGGGGETRA